MFSEDEWCEELEAMHSRGEELQQKMPAYRSVLVGSVAQLKKQSLVIWWENNFISPSNRITNRPTRLEELLNPNIDKENGEEKVGSTATTQSLCLEMLFTKT
ncbi:hypothetical protein GQR58_005870 [Nymphon striatum]|nr:hypothetical protein GQR58_005870 [Nymphon striatum]